MEPGSESAISSQFQEFTYPELTVSDHTLEDNLVAPQGHSRTRSTRQQPEATIGVLGSLPNELMSSILCQLDLATLWDLRCVNRWSAELVDSLPLYRALLTHAAPALRGIYAIHTGRWITCQTLYDKLCKAECEMCGDFAGYLYLITCKRVCYLCVVSDEKSEPISPGHARRAFGLDQKTVSKLPKMKVLPGVYSPRARTIKPASVLVDYDSAWLAGVEVAGSLQAMYKEQNRQHRIYREKLSAARESGTKLPPPPHSDPTGGGRPFVAVIRLPWLNTTSKRTERGAYCIACRNQSDNEECDEPSDSRKLYTPAFFDDHLEDRGRIQLEQVRGYRIPMYMHSE